ncbi:MAG: acetyl/propionyl/methylcrotonyl-CoA carboxylase subunit alpha [Gaiellales bacterium]
MGDQIRRLLIANRGEIAVRVIRACRETGIQPVAVYEPADRESVHAGLAEAVEVPSYLDGQALVEAAAVSGADAVHPGYGYLAENAGFAEQVQKAGLVWVGPSPQAMRSVGDKLAARRLAQAAGVAVTPGYDGVDLSDATLAAEAGRLGFPLLVKAAAGGGGRGMRRVDDPSGLPDAIAAARREAEAAFGDGRVYLERLQPAARHVEVQILADAHGNAIHLGERDCSVQRRHQKIAEESPSPAVDEGLRGELGEAALAVARAAAYTGAGTAEFLLAADGSWWFLELNARLQVEHPVTEAVAGTDLVRAQLEIAAGGTIELDPDDVRLRGHALELRLYAEDPASGFLPASGRLERFDVPSWPGLRVDSGATAGDEVGLRYDPLLAKLIAHAEDRDACIDRMAAALADTVVLGVATNLGFLRWLVAHPAFRAGEVDTGFVEREWSPALVPELPDEVRRAALRTLGAGNGSAWYAFTPPAREHVVTAGRWVLHEGWQYEVEADSQAAAEAVAGAGSLEAPMPGTVLRVEVSPGQPVEQGRTLVVLEAKKMELAVSAPGPGTVTDVHVRPGELVSRGQPLIAIAVEAQDG